MQKQITQQFPTIGTDTSGKINEYMQNKIATGEFFDIKIDKMFPFDKQYYGGTEKWLMVVFSVKYPWGDK